MESINDYVRPAIMQELEKAGVIKVTPMKVICAWCNKHLRGPEDAELISHGICPECKEKELKNL